VVTRGSIAAVCSAAARRRSEITGPGLSALTTARRSFFSRNP
jgi:hypothetical protein